LGLEGAIARFDELINLAAASIPACSCRDMLRQLVQAEAERLVPKAMCEGHFKTHPKVLVALAQGQLSAPH
jgi:geranylgeranyl diphosphate synthase type II